MELVAHRAGNRPSTIDAAVAVADAIELDIHRFRGRLEVRHAKVLWPLATRWERWELVPANEPRPTLEEIVSAIPAGTHLWLDLKGFTPVLTRRALAAVGDRFALTVSTRSWWILGPARRRPNVRVMRSVGNRLQLALVQRLAPSRRRRRRDGVVMHARLADADSLAAVRRGSSPVFAWAVDDLDRVVELAELGVDGVIIDDLGLIAAARRRFATRP